MRHLAQNRTASTRPRPAGMRLRMVGATAALVAATALAGCSTTENPPESGTQI